MTAKRHETIGAANDPLDHIGKPARPARGKKRSPPSQVQPEAELRSKGPKKMRATFHIPTDLFEEVRDAVYCLSGPPLRLTLATFAENALRDELRRVKLNRNKGKSFPKRAGELKGGRPIKV